MQFDYWTIGKISFFVLLFFVILAIVYKSLISNMNDLSFGQKAFLAIVLMSFVGIAIFYFMITGGNL